MPSFVNKQKAVKLEGPWVSVLILVHQNDLATPQLNNEGSFGFLTLKFPTDGFLFKMLPFQGTFVNFRGGLASQALQIKG